MCEKLNTPAPKCCPAEHRAPNLTARFHKMNVYETGGFFADHKDTPRSELHFGSLVVCLPCAFEGGVLTVDHLGEKRDVDWGRFFRPSGMYTWQKDYAARLAAHTPPRTLRWAAFFGDANHKVVPVASGARVTLAFELYRERPPTPPRRGSPSRLGGSGGTFWTVWRKD